MDGVLLAGLITAVIGAVPAIIGALAILRKAQTPTTQARNALQALWDWLEYAGLQDKVPSRLRRATLAVLESDRDDDIRDDQKQ